MISIFYNKNLNNIDVHYYEYNFYEVGIAELAYWYEFILSNKIVKIKTTYWSDTIWHFYMGE